MKDFLKIGRWHDDIQKIALRYVEAQGRYDILDIINKAKDGK